MPLTEREYGNFTLRVDWRIKRRLTRTPTCHTTPGFAGHSRQGNEAGRAGL
jgi:hypothetical protein